MIEIILAFVNSLLSSMKAVSIISTHTSKSTRLGTGVNHENEIIYLPLDIKHDAIAIYLAQFDIIKTMFDRKSIQN